MGESLLLVVGLLLIGKGWINNCDHGRGARGLLLLGIVHVWVGLELLVVIDNLVILLVVVDVGLLVGNGNLNLWLWVVELLLVEGHRFNLRREGFVS